MFYILTKKIGCVPYFFQLIVSEERADRIFTVGPWYMTDFLRKELN
ncbi:hypothetical protein D1AOALGA4SA_12896 [Olavius algarvensis Delta 1 endosymbiont]|nr:hypothetical protein D1AOALGA4SA_12896 [Olavius algarvensis Delta 1 endosymbiont]